MCHGVSEEGREHLAGDGSLVPCGSQELNSHWQASWQAESIC